MLELIKQALEAASTEYGINPAIADDYIRTITYDKRHLYWRAATCSWSYNESGIVEYAGRKYYYIQSENTVNVTYA